MAGRGPAPKPSDQRRRRNKPETPVKVVETDGALRGPDLPDTFEWPAPTVAWWQTWRQAPQAQEFTDTDWSFLLDTAVLHAEFWLGNRALAGELRLRAAKFGATPEDRARLKLEVGEPLARPGEPAKKLQPKKSTDRRKRLLQAVEPPAGDEADDAAVG